MTKADDALNDLINKNKKVISQSKEKRSNTKISR